MKKIQSSLDGFSNLPGVMVATGKASKLLVLALNEGRKALSNAIHERKNSPASCIIRHRYSNEGSFKNYQLHELGEIEQMVALYQSQGKACTPQDIVIELGYKKRDTSYVGGLIDFLVGEKVILLDSTTQGYLISTARTDKPQLVGGRQEVPSFRF